MMLQYSNIVYFGLNIHQVADNPTPDNVAMNPDVLFTNVSNTSVRGTEVVLVNSKVGNCLGPQNQGGLINFKPQQWLKTFN